MISDYRCFFCFSKAYGNLLNKLELSHQKKGEFTHFMAELYAQTYINFSAPKFSRELHAKLRELTGEPDHYRDIKKQSNDLVMSMYPDLKRMVEQSDNPFDTALRLAIAGNIIDFAVGSEFNLDAQIEHVLKSDFAIDDSNELKRRLGEAQTVLYIGDNCGEIVLDKLFIETIGHPNVYFAVRGAPVINDATIDDAHYVGIDRVTKVISNGYDAPSTVLDCSSKEFLEIYSRADVIISKGQGNLEGLLGEEKQKLFFLLMVKCNVIADALGVRKGDFVVRKNKNTDYTDATLVSLHNQAGIFTDNLL